MATGYSRRSREPYGRRLRRASLVVSAILGLSFVSAGVAYGSPAAKAAPKHGEAAKAQMQQMQMPEAPADPLDWSLEQVKKASFMESAVYAGSLCRALEAGSAGAEHAERLKAMLGHSDGARGFFVTYLTDPALEKIADAPEGIPSLVGESLKASDISVVAPLAVMNVAMPTATVLTHKEAGDEKSAANSARTARRGKLVLQLLASDATTGPFTRKKLEACLEAANAWPEKEEVDKDWATFLRRWKYDEKQIAAIREVLESAQSQLEMALFTNGRQEFED
eukprot:CAMPEP_0197660386 /NCGR_PEP_ID=MMETSP1338-20131121/50816_1 /TAXON_ID=43686 ORGANISM="Pelagodinium beii, Strain RCC1491" /NCGR_SAMPLE_ID=MMETSP1338 /ASSEMBLY_ACC=CAM_ASM_000754 /LENGTH=279 /DNA_ID=CAMNT_0043237723 /DNA_START=42 /DNA_END=879 /DNA_ORIENTATION=-